MGLGGLESQSASNLRQGQHYTNILAAPVNLRDDVQSQATYSKYNIDRGSSTGWLANTGSASVVGDPSTATTVHQFAGPLTLVSPYSQSNLTEYGNQIPHSHAISKNQSSQLMQHWHPTQSQTLTNQSQGASASQQQLAQMSSITKASAGSATQLPADPHLHTSQLIQQQQKDQIIQKQAQQIKELSQLVQSLQSNMIKYEVVLSNNF